MALVPFDTQFQMESEWHHQKVDGRNTAQSLGQTSSVAVVRWKDRYRHINCVDTFVSMSQLRFIFGVFQSAITMENSCSGTVQVKISGVLFTVNTWVLRKQRTLPPNGPRVRLRPEVDYFKVLGIKDCWRRHIDWSKLPDSPSRTRGEAFLRRCAARDRVVLLRRKIHGCFEYRVIYWRYPRRGDTVQIQGVDGKGTVLRIEDRLCDVLIAGIVLRVHGTCTVPAE